MLWVVVVAAVSALTFIVVDGVGRSVGQVTTAPDVRADPGVKPSTTATASPTATQASPSAVAPSPTAPESVGDTPITEPPPPTEAPGDSTEPPPASQPTGPQIITGSFSNPGGTVVVSCQGSTLTVGGISPRDGFKVENEMEGGHLSVKFSNSRSEYSMELGCGGSGPVVLSAEGAPVARS